MNQLVLEWFEAGQIRTQTISDQQLSKNPGTVRIGRDASLCDVVLSDLTVSPLHTEIFFDPQQQCFYLRNLRDTNPPVVNGLLVSQGQVMLDEGTTIQLGAVELKVQSISLSQPPPGYTPTNYATQTTPPPYQPTVQATQYTQPPSQNPVQPTIPVPPNAWQSSPPVSPPPPHPNPPTNYPLSRSNNLPLVLGIGFAALAAIGIGVSIASNRQWISDPGASPNAQATQTNCSAVVTGSIRSEPTSSQQNQLNVEGNQFPVTGKQTPGGWVELRLPNGSLGWSHRSVISNSSEMDSCIQSNGVAIQTAEDLTPPPEPVQPSQAQQPSLQPDGQLVACRERWDDTKCKSTDDYYNPNEPSQQLPSQPPKPPSEIEAFCECIASDNQEVISTYNGRMSHDGTSCESYLNGMLRKAVYSCRPQ